MMLRPLTFLSLLPCGFGRFWVNIDRDLPNYRNIYHQWTFFNRIHVKIKMFFIRENAQDVIFLGAPVILLQGGRDLQAPRGQAKLDDIL